MVEEAAWKMRNQSWSRCGNTRMPALTVNEVSCVRQLIRVVPPVPLQGGRTGVFSFIRKMFCPSQITVISRNNRNG